jgi:uncharacterized membrane protein YraQ (UPF0718 family)
MSALSAGVDALRETLLLTLHVAPYFLIGAVAGAMLQALLSPHWSERLFGGGGFRPLFTAIGVAAAFPGCSCATMPLAAGLKGSASPRLGTIAAFIFMSPLLSPVTVALTWGMLGGSTTVARVVASVVGSLLLGLLLNGLEPWLNGVPRKQTGVPTDVSGPDPCACELPDIRTPGDCQVRFWSSLWTILRAITPYFLLGMLIAGVLSALLPEDAIPRYLGGSTGTAAYLLAAIVGVPLYVCEGEEVPITYALVARGLDPGPSLTFLLGSVGTCIPTILMARKIIGDRATALYAVFWFAFVIVAGVLFQALVETTKLPVPA